MRAFIFILACSSSSHAQEISIIVNERSEIASLNAEQIQRIFLRKYQLTEQGDRWIPVNLSAHNLVRKSVTEQFLPFTSFELERYWDAQYFNGISPPYVLASEEAVLRFVSKTPNAIAYILSCHVSAGVKVVYTFNDKKLTSKLCP